MDSKPAMRKPNVLVVDDKRSNIFALEAVLGNEHSVHSALSGEEALALLKSNRSIDVVLMDVQMPVLDGFQTAALIKKLDGYEDVPIIFVSAVYTENPYIKQGFKAGGIDYFGKPFDPEILKMWPCTPRSGRRCAESVERDAYGEILGWWDASGQVLRHGEGPLSRALHGGKSSHSERMEIRCCDGSQKTILASAAPLRALDNQIVGAVALIQDLSASEKIEEDLEQRVTQLIGIGVELEGSAAGR
jgi:CheY-like chemotaxis protein